MKYKCPCCGFYTFEHRPNGSYDLCDVCYWEDDPIQLDDPDFDGALTEFLYERPEKISSGLVLVRKK